MQKALGITKKTKTKTKAQKIMLPIGVGIFIFLVLIVCGTFAYVQSFQDKIYPGVKVASFDLGGDSKSEALDTIQKRIDKLNNIGLILSDTDEGDESVSYEDLGITFDKNATYEKAYQYGRDKVNKAEDVYDMYKALFQGENIPLVTNFDDEKFESKINELASSKIQESKDASYKIVNDKLEINPEENGTSIDFSLLKKDIEKLDSSENIYGKITLRSIDDPALLTSSDLENLKDDMQKYLNQNIVYKNNNVEYVPTVSDKLSWFKIEKNSDPKIVISDDGIKEYVSKLSSKIDKKTINTKVDAQTGKVISEGTNGITLDQSKALIDTKSALNSNKDNVSIVLKTNIEEKQEVKVQSESKKSGGTAGLYDGKYIEVNLTTQILYLFDGDNEQGSYSVSTGKWDMPTPTGTRTVSAKSDRAWSAKYGLYMPYWMDIGGGYGIHELPEWPNGYKEGESHLGTPVSHGCIRLGIGAAQTVYGWAPIGTQVFIHY